MDARLCEWSDLEIFFEVARAGTLGAAAEKLRVDASTVHRRLGKLEAAMRSKLFLRSQRGFALTEAGEDLFAHATAMEAQAASAFRKVVARDEQQLGTVRLSTADDLAVNIVPPIVAGFRAKHPRVTVVVDVGGRAADLDKREADVAFRFAFTSPLTGDAVGRRVLSVGGAFFASRAYLKRHGRPKKPEDLVEHTVVRLDGRFKGVASERLIDRFGDPAKIALRSGSFYALYGAIRAGLGVGLLPYFVAAPDKRLERLDLEFPEPIPPASLYVLIHTDMRKNARVRAFVEHAIDALSSQKALFERGVV